VASQKDKLLDSAQKYILKGQFDKAVKEYEQIVALEPKDIRHRQKLAELLVRGNRNGEALKHYEAIARSYSTDKFYLKAIAVYKQIQKLDPKNIEVSLTLAELNEKQGLLGNALAEYKVVVDYYEALGKTREAAGVLGKMLALDPENLNVQLKLAETWFAAGNKDAAYEEFNKALLLLKGRGDTVTLDKVSHRMKGLFPGREVGLEALEQIIKNGQAATAIPKLREVLKTNEKNLQALLLLAEAYQATNDLEQRAQSYRQIQRLFPEELCAKTGLIDCAIEGRDLEKALTLLNFYTADLHKAGSDALLEECYKRLQEQAPYDNRILEGLKHLYETTGETGKLEDVISRLALETGTIGGGESFAPVSGDLDFSELELPTEPVIADVSVVPPHQEPVEEHAWEEEIEIALPEDDPVPLLEQPEEDEEVSLPPEVEIELPGDGEELLLDANEAEPEYAEMEVIETYAADDGHIHLSLEELMAEDDDVVNIDDISIPDPNNLFDLSDEFADDAPDDGVGKASKYSFSGVLSAFKKGVEQHLDKGDTETHYNLGIAYKEMGLFNEAIAEFKVASEDPLRRVDCLALKGVCYRDKGDLDKAEEIFRVVAEEPGLAIGEILSLKYELALLYEISRRNEEALAVYLEVNAIEPGFRDVARKIALLRGDLDDLALPHPGLVDIEWEEID